MNEPRYAARVGAFVVLALVLIAALLLVFSKGQTWFTATYTLRLRAENVGGLKSRAPVTVSGVTVGRVLDTELAPDGKGVTILLRVGKRFEIHRDARFMVEQVGLLGDQFVVIYPTTNQAPLLRDGDEVECSSPFNLQEVVRSTVGFMQRVDQTTRVLNEAITRVNETLLSPRTLTNLVQAVDNFRGLSERANTLAERVDGVVASNATPVATALTNLVRFSEELTQVATNLQGAVAENRSTLGSTLKSLEGSSATFSRLVSELDAGQGAVGSLLKDSQLQINLSNTLANLAAAASNVANYGLLYKPRKPKAPGK